MLIISHRGYHKKLQSNTLVAFEAAIAMGADGIETDVRITKDNQLILFHDRYIGQSKIKDLTYREILSATDFQVPLVREALERFDKVLWNLEIKSDSALPAVCELIRQYHESNRLLISSFWHNIAEHVASVIPCDCGVLISHRPFDVIDFAWFQDRGINFIIWDYEFVDDDTLARAQAAGIKSLAFKIHTRQEHEEALTRAFHGIITDHLEYVSSTRAA